MKYTISTVTEAQVETIVDLFVNKNSMVTFEREDIEPVIEGKACLMIEAIQEEENREEFFRLIRNELYERDEARDCQSMLVYAEMPDEDCSILDEMDALQSFLMDVSYGADIIWGVDTCNAIDGMKVIVVVA